MPPVLPTPPATLEDFKTRYGKRDFVFGDGTDKVTDADIANAMIDAMTVFNPRLFSVADGWVAFQYLVAHFLRTNIEAVGGLQACPEGLGVENQGEQVLTGGSVSGVSSNYLDPPDWIKRFPLLQQLWLTKYGQQYCFVVQPKIMGNVHAVSGPRDFGTIGTPSVPFTEF